MRYFFPSALVGFCLALLLTVAIAGCGTPKPEWSTSILDGPDRAPPECDEAGDPDVKVPAGTRTSIDKAAQWQDHTLDVVAELRARKAKCGAWAKQQRRSRN